MAEYYIAPKTSFDATADAIREKIGSQATIEWTQDGFADAIEEIQSGGYTLEQISSPKFLAMTTQNVVFTGTSLQPGIFAGNTYIKTFVGNNIINLSSDMWPDGYSNPTKQFRNCSNLESVSIPLVTNFNRTDNIFENCTALKNVNITWGNVTNLATSFFSNCPALELYTLVMPKLNSNVWGHCFKGVTNLTTFDGYYGAAGNQSIYNNSFENTSISIIILRRTAGIISLGNINAFNGTPFASNGVGGTLYVPSALISTYQSATNWATILGYTNNSIKSIESTHTDSDAPIDLTLYYADGTEIPTT